MTSPQARRLLRAVARANGVATSYLDYAGKRVEAKPDAMARLIDGLREGPLVREGTTDANLLKVWKLLRAERDLAGLPRVVVAWDGKFPALWLKPETDEIVVSLKPEDGEAIMHVQHVGDAPRGAHDRVRLVWPDVIPHGYYSLSAGPHTTFLISAPRRASQDGEKSWGAFAPTYALRSADDQGIGGYRELAHAARFVKAHGGAFLGTLPLLPAFYEGDAPQPSPYSPVSRLFWNEIYIDLGDLPGAAAIDADLGDLFSSCRKDELVDYEEIYRVKKRVLSNAAEAFFADAPDGDEAFRAYAAATPLLGAYAEFRAGLVPADERAAAVRFHKYAQYACHRQLADMKARAGNDCAELYLDYPVGVHPDGFDARAFSPLFLQGFNVGAPPDMFFGDGQDWGFRALNPRALMADRFQYFRATIHHYFQYARMLRLDHVMGLFRLYCVPHGDKAANGGYIYYPFEALLAILCLEAQRHDGILVGEDLGTVPAAIEDGMTMHALHRMWILYFQMNELPARSFASIEPDMIAGLNTHDMFPLKAFLAGADIGELQRLGLMTEKRAKDMRRDREKIVRKWNREKRPLQTALEGLAASPARFVLIGMEDLWGETEPQNVPGTTDQYPNWRRKFKVPVEDWARHPEVREALDILNDYRKAKAA